MATQLTFQFEEGRSIPTSPLQYIIRPISYKLAMQLVIEQHYLHRQAPCTYAFGIYTPDDIIIGVITYGSPASRSLQKGICGNDEADSVIELTRSWVDDKAPKNIESFFISKTIKMVPKDIIVSYAEIQQGHLGIVYQASNWIYTGLSAKRHEWRLQGLEARHTRSIFDKYGGINASKKIFGDRMYARQRPRKHRYVFFNCPKKRRKELLAKLRYKAQPYPKKIEAFQE